MVWPTSNKIYVLGSLDYFLAYFPVVTAISGDLPSPRTAVHYISMFATTNFLSLFFLSLSLPKIEPLTYLLLVVGQTIGLLSQ